MDGKNFVFDLQRFTTKTQESDSVFSYVKNGTTHYGTKSEFVTEIKGKQDISDIKLFGDLTLTDTFKTYSTIEVTGNVILTFKNSNKTIPKNIEYYGTSAIIRVAKDASLTFISYNYNSIGRAPLIKTQKAGATGIEVEEGGTLIVEGKIAPFNSASSAIKSSGTVIINDGGYVSTANVKAAAIQVDAGTLTIEGGTITNTKSGNGGAAINNVSGNDVVITGGNITGSLDGGNYDVSGGSFDEPLEPYATIPATIDGKTQYYSQEALAKKIAADVKTSITRDGTTYYFTNLNNAKK